MSNNAVLTGAAVVNLWLRIHDEVIIPVGAKELSVDEGFSKFVKIVYGMNSYLSLQWREKLNILLELACVSYAVKRSYITSDRPEDLYKHCSVDLSGYLN